MTKKKNILTLVREWFQAHPDEYMTKEELASKLELKVTSLASCLGRYKESFTTRSINPEDRGKGKPAITYCYNPPMEDTTYIKPGMPLQGNEKIFALSEQVQKLKSLLDGERIPAIFLTGGVKTGKTSLVNWLANKARSHQEFLVLTVNFENAMFGEETRLSLSSLFREFFRQICAGSEELIQEIGQQPSVEEMDTFQAFNYLGTILSSYLESHPNKKVLLVVDGLDAIGIHGLTTNSFDQGVAKINSQTLENMIFWLGGLRTRMIEYPFSRIKLLTTMGAHCYTSLLSKPLLTQNLTVPIPPLSTGQIRNLLQTINTDDKNNPQLADELASTLNGQIFLTHLAIQLIADKRVEAAYFLQPGFLNTQGVIAFWSQIKKMLQVSLELKRHSPDDFLKLCQTLLDFTRDSRDGDTRYIIETLWQQLELNGVINDLGKIASPIFEELILKETDLHE